jgi:glycosyltransferase involved in cell wall biosynthesis
MKEEPLGKTEISKLSNNKIRKNNKMKVLFNTQSIGFQMMGGLEVQMLQTKKHLEKLGVNVKLFDPFHDKLEDFDILHIFGSYSYETVPITKMAKEKNIPITISSVYWISSRKKLIDFGTKLLSIFSENYALINPPKYLFSLANIILPNSRLEAELLIKQFNIDRKKIFVVPNGVERRFLHGDPDIFIQKYGIEDFVLFVGHIEERKNVLRLIKAMNDIEVPLVIIGTPMSAQRYYYNICKKEANDNIHFLGGINHDSELLSSAYSAAKVFALPSWAETPGIATLEAGLAGCNIVITNRGSTTEYFKNFATYCNIDVKSIRNAIIEAYSREKSEELINHILDNYTWDVVAKKTLAAYDLIVKR